MLNKKLLNVLWAINILFLLTLSFALFYIAIYNPCLLTPVILLAILILITILVSSSMLNRMLHTRAGNTLSIFIILFFIFGYYKGYIIAQKPPLDYFFIGITFLFIMIIYYIYDLIKGDNRISFKGKN